MDFFTRTNNVIPGSSVYLSYVVTIHGRMLDRLHRPVNPAVTSTVLDIRLPGSWMDIDVLGFRATNPLALGDPRRGAAEMRADARSGPGRDPIATQRSARRETIPHGQDDPVYALSRAASLGIRGVPVRDADVPAERV